MSLDVERWSEIEPPRSSVLRRRMEAEGYTVTEWRDEPGTTYGAHSHAQDQSHWIISGTMKFRVGWEDYILRAGDRDYLPANTEHSAAVAGDEAVVYLIGVKC